MTSKFADLAEPSVDDFREGSVAWLIERYIKESLLPGMRPLGASHVYSLRGLQRLPIGSKRAGTLRKQDIIAHCQERRAKVVAATVNHDVTALRGVLKYAGAAWDDCEDVSDAPIAAAGAVLTQHGLVGKSTPRTRIPTDAEVTALLNYFRDPKRASRMEIRMPDLIAAALESSRRVSELCRWQHGDIDWTRTDAAGNPTPMYMIRDLKHPTKKLGNHKWFPLTPNLAEIVRMQPRRSPDNPTERVFPFNSKSASAAYTIAKKALGIQGLRFHDNRRAAITKWLALLKSPHKVKLISGHETTQILERVYDATQPDVIHAELAAISRSNEWQASTK